MKKILLIARWEYLTTVMRGTYLFAVIAMPLLFSGMFVLMALAGRSANVSSGASLPAAVVDRAHVADIAEAAARTAERDLARTRQIEQIGAMVGRQSPVVTAAINEALATPRLVAYDDLDAALSAMRARKVSGVFLIEADYLQTGAVTSYTRDSGMFTAQGEGQRRNILADALRAGLLKQRVDDSTFTRAFTPLGRVTRLSLDTSGQFSSAAGGALGALAGPFGLFMLLTMTIFFSAGFLQQATLADRQNRMLEILLSSVSPNELVVGKLIGLAAAGLTQVGLYLLLIVAPGAVFFAVFQVSSLSLVLSILFFLVGYVTFASLMIATGMVGRTAQESAQLSTIWMMMAAMPWFFVANISAAPNGLIARGLSFFPVTSAVAMMMRIATAPVAPLEIAAVLMLDGIAMYLIVRAAARLFRAWSLMFGKRFTLPELIRWLRAA